MAFLVNFRLRSDSDRPESEASPTEMEPVPYVVNRLDPKRHSTFPMTKSLGSATSAGGSRPVRAEPACRGASAAPAALELVPRPRGGSASRAPWTHRCWLRGQRGDWGLAHVSGRRASSGDHAALSVLIMGPQTEFQAFISQSVRSCPLSPSPSPLRGSPVRPAAAGAADPAQRMPVIPLCRLAGVKGHGEERGGKGDGAVEWGGEEAGRGEARAGPAAPAAQSPATPNPTPQ